MQFKTLLIAAIGATSASAQTDPAGVPEGYSTAYTALQTAVNAVQTQLAGLEAAAQTRLSGTALIAEYSGLEASAASALASLYSSFGQEWGGVTALPTITGVSSTPTAGSDRPSNTGASDDDTSSDDNDDTTPSAASSSTRASGTASGSAASETGESGAAAVSVPYFAGLLALLAAL